MPSIGLWEWVFIFLIVLVIFGPKSLPKIGQALGRGIREFKDAARGLTSDEEDRRNQVSQQTPPATTQPGSQPEGTASKSQPPQDL